MIKSSEFLEYIEKANMWDHNINYRQQPEFYVYTKDCGGTIIQFADKMDWL